MAFIGNHKPTFCDRTIPDFVASVSWSIVIAAGLLKEITQLSMKIHGSYAKA